MDPAAAWELVLAVGAGAGAVATIAALLWWLVGPRVRGYLDAYLTTITTALTEHDRRITRTEAVLEGMTHPAHLVELANLYDVVARHAPPVGLVDLPAPAPPPPPPGRTRP